MQKIEAEETIYLFWGLFTVKYTEQPKKVNICYIVYRRLQTLPGNIYGYICYACGQRRTWDDVVVSGRIHTYARVKVSDYGQFIIESVQHRLLVLLPTKQHQGHKTG